MAATLILQLPRDGALDRFLETDPPDAVRDRRVALDRGPADSHGILEHPGPGEVVASVPSPEGLQRDADDIEHAIRRAGHGVEPLVVVVDAASELRDEELAPVLDAAPHTDRGVILRVLGDG
jgi:hypothetical protein